MEGPRLSSESAPVFVTVRVVERRLILKNAAKRFVRVSKLLGTKHQPFSTNLLIADSSP
jgi:hypothetical protein